MIYALKLKKRLQLNIMKELLRFGHQERIENSCWPNKCQKFVVSSTVAKEQEKIARMKVSREA